MSAIETPDETLPVEWVERETLMPNEWNPNTMSEQKREELVYSITDNGWTQPIIVDPDTNEIIDGEQRWHASRDARVRTDDELTPDGVENGFVPVFYLDVDDTQARVATVQHNINGDTNSDSLGEIFADLDKEGMFYDTAERFQLGETGIDRLIERAESDEDTPEAFGTPEEAEDELETDDGMFTESLEFQMTVEEAETVQAVLDEADCSVLEFCLFVVAEDIHTQTRVDMRDVADRDAVYEYGEEPIEYPGVDIDKHLSRYYRDDDPEEVTDGEER